MQNIVLSPAETKTLESVVETCLRKMNKLPKDMCAEVDVKLLPASLVRVNVRNLSDSPEDLDRVLALPVSHIRLARGQARFDSLVKALPFLVVGEIARLTRSEITKYRNFGKKSCDELEEALKKLNLSLGMNVSVGDLEWAARLKRTISTTFLMHEIETRLQGIKINTVGELISSDNRDSVLKLIASFDKLPPTEREAYDRWFHTRKTVEDRYGYICQSMVKRYLA